MRMRVPALLGCLGALTFRQTFVYHDVESLYRDTIAKNSASWIAYLNLGTHLDGLGHSEEALRWPARARL